jgi:hypothetical protein
MKMQNFSSAVMEQRQVVREGEYGPRGIPKPLDYFPTPPWAVRAACAFLEYELREPLELQTVWEPACGEGHMVHALKDHFVQVRQTDIYRYHPEHGICDFLLDGRTYSPVDWVFTNPPFQKALEFIQTAQRVARRGVVMFVRSAFLESAERYATIFHPDIAPSYVATYTERVVLLRDRLIRANELDPFNLVGGKPQRASSATSYSIVVWLPGENDTRHRWISPCRLEYERPDDYPLYAEQWAEISLPEAVGSLL